MRLSVRPKLGIILSLVTILTVVSGFMVVAIASRGPNAHAVSAAGVSYHNAHGQLAARSLHLGGQNPAQAASQTVYATPNHFGKQTVNSTTTAARSAPGVDGLSVLSGSAATLLHIFNEPGTPFSGGELVSDPRCIYDKPTDTFFLTALAACSPAVGCKTTESHIDLVVYNPNSGAAKEYKIDDTFPALTNLAIGGIPVTSLQPAISTSATNTEFLANSFPFLADGENNPVANTLGFWKVTGDSNVTSGDFNAVVISAKIISSESYAFPVLALSTGSGARRSSAFLNPDDSRLQTCQFVSGDIWCSLSTAINIKNDPATRDGVAWFELSTSGTIAAQGYVAAAGKYLIYPAIVHSASGSTGIVFTLTSGSNNPSAAYVFAASGV